MLLQRLGIPFEIRAPSIDETPLENEKPAQLVERLATEKAAVVASAHPADMVIGSDQVAECGGRVLGKPGTVENACEQLASFSGQTVNFITAVCLRGEEAGFEKTFTVNTRVAFRHLESDEIRRYVEHDMPLDCAGAFKSEAAGISLLTRMESTDPTAIIGLPLIELSAVLREAGYRIP